MSAGALCLYAATLLTKVHETSPQNIQCEYESRENDLKATIKSHPRYSNLTEDQLSTMAHNLILRDIRNSIAHGNFEIDFNIHTKKLYYILRPRRKDFVVDTPIIISKDALFAANRQHVGKLSIKFILQSKEQIQNTAYNSFGNTLKDFVLPVDMLKLAENYLDVKLKHYNRYKPNENRYMALYYPLLATQMTYEQDDYYNMFEKDSNIFHKIALIRNSISHNEFSFNNKTLDITHTDREKTTTDSLQKNVEMLKLIRDHKNLVIHTKKLGFDSSNSQYLIDKIKCFFDSLFIHGAYEEELSE
jgi:hypothetical protein